MNFNWRHALYMVTTVLVCVFGGVAVVVFLLRWIQFLTEWTGVSR